MAQAVSTRGPVSGTATAGKKRRKFFLLDLYSTAVGKKYAMALSGIALMGFVLFHMVGNLKMYLGAEEINHYAEFLRELLVPLLPRGVALWILRIGLIGAAVLHIHAAYSLTVLNREARSVKYQSERDYQVANFASRTIDGPASSCSCSCCGTSPTSHGARSIRATCGAMCTGVGASCRGCRWRLVHRRQHRARHSPVSRCMEPVSVDGLDRRGSTNWRHGCVGFATIVVGNVYSPSPCGGIVES